MPSSVEELMAATSAVRWAFHLTPSEHRLVCEEALRRGEQQLADDLFKMEMHAN
jgi:hypothetical protein